MNELKARHIVDVYDSYYAENPFGERSQVYLKSEADKVIAELKDKCQMHNFFWDGCGFAKRGFKNTIAVSEAYDFLEKENAQLKESIAVYQRNERLDIRDIRHHKYKRCLAMAQEWRNYAAFYWMQSSCHNHRGFGKTAEKYTWKEIHAWKCVKRMHAIAEKFKEAK